MLYYNRSQSSIVPNPFPQTNSYKQNDSYVMEIILNDYDKEDIVVELLNNDKTLKISGKIKKKHFSSNYQEIITHEFERSYLLPDYITGIPIMSEMKQGLLRLIWKISKQEPKIKRIIID